MKLHLTATSERGKPVTKSGNEYIIIEVKDDNREIICFLKIYADKTARMLYNFDEFEHRQVVEHRIEEDIFYLPKPKTEREYKVRCNMCMNTYTEEQLVNIGDAKACPVCQADSYLMDNYKE